MKQVFKLAMLTLFFSSLAGVGVTAGFYCFVGGAQLLGRMFG
ncbi:sodium:solute symporter [Pectobacterium odoriferum]|uniref:Sodium:solute symporter n=1 Tax=Pectobacterium odoriferum TaxID=78398 RepID=A0ABR4VJQ8_9GAMM|nr:sodium:solute symporter [Pectobacterium odoriferum]